MQPLRTAALVTALILGSATPLALRAEMSIYIVAPGDTLWSIAGENLKSPHDWRKLMEFNGMSDQSQLQVDQELRIPMDWLKASFAPVVEANRPANLPPVATTPARKGGSGAAPAPARHTPPAAPAQPAAPVYKALTVIATYGQAERIEGSRRIPLEPNDTLAAGSRVASGKQGGLNIHLRDGSMAVLLPESEVELTQPLQLLRGALEYNTDAGDDAAPLVKSGGFTLQGRQTHFRLSRQQGEAIQLEVESGSVTLISDQGERTLGAGLALLAESGKPLAEPRQGLLRPDVANLPKRGVNGRIELDWAAIGGAAAYRAQLIYATDNYLVLLDERVAQPRIRWSNISPGFYKIRLRSVDEKGLEGLSAELPFTVQGTLEAPHSNSPIDGATLPGNTPWLAWSRVPEANSYTLQVARDPAFKSGVQEFSYLVNNYHRYSDPLPPGDYYWRVLSVSPKREQSPFGEVRRFHIK